MPLTNPVIAASLLLLTLPLGRAQTGALSPEQFVLSRPGNPAGAAPVYRRVSVVSQHASQLVSQPASPLQTRTFSALLGFTLWRLHPAGPQDTGASLFASPKQLLEWAAERVEASESFRPGDRIRLSLESPKRGYLYVIDREQFAHGAAGDPYLVFPTMRTRGGDNEVSAGKLIDIPEQDDEPNYLTVRKTRPDQVGELLTIIMAPEPLTDIAVGASTLHLDARLVEQWEKQWTQRMETFELAGGAGQQWTVAERNAALSGDARLTASDPPPQTLFQTNAQGATPILIRVQLHYATDHEASSNEPVKGREPRSLRATSNEDS